MIEAQTEYDLVWASIHHLEWSEAMSESIVLPTHPRFKNLTGLSFGRWTVVAYRGRHKSRPTSWLCRCECGTERIVISSSLVAVSGTQSCGCFQKEQLASRMLTHGYSSAAEHMAWASLKDTMDMVVAASAFAIAGEIRSRTSLPTWANARAMSTRLIVKITTATTNPTTAAGPPKKSKAAIVAQTEYSHSTIKHKR